jgi:hypothetical protein
MIYFTQDTQTRAIKIGYSKNPQKRRAGLQSSTPGQLVLLGYVPGGLEYERAFHDKFAAYRLHGEWFSGEITSEVMRIISQEAAKPGPMTTNVIVAGNSALDFMWSSDPQQNAEKQALEAAVVRALEEIHAKTRIEWVIVGWERQIETFAVRWAKRNNINVCPYLPNWRRYGKGAAAKAGKQMIHAMFDHKTLLVFPGVKISSTIQALIRQAEKVGIEVVRKERSSFNEQAQRVPIQGAGAGVQ